MGPRGEVPAYHAPITSVQKHLGAATKLPLTLNRCTTPLLNAEIRENLGLGLVDCQQVVASCAVLRD
jgi:hypothetical protein